MVDSGAQTGEEDNLSASEVCCCGPHHDLDERRRNQILKVERRSTDMCSLFAIFVYMIFMLLVWFYAVEKGQYKIVMNGMDWKGRACGSGELANYPHQAWSNPLMKNIGAGAVCVEKCPAPADGQEIANLELMCICNPKYWPEKFTGPQRSTVLLEECSDSTATLQGYFSKGVESGSSLLNDARTNETGGVDQPCAFVHRTKWSMRKCIPWLSSANLAKIVDQSRSNVKADHDFIVDLIGTTNAMFSSFMTDIMDCKEIIWMCVFTAIVVSLATMVMLRYCVKFVAHAILVVLFAMFVLSAILCYQEYSNYAARVDTVPSLLTQAEDQQSMYIFLSCFVGACVLTVLHVCFSVFMYSELGAAISITEVASSTFEDAPQILLYPVLHVLAFITMFVAWLIGAILLYSAGDIKSDNKGVAYMQHTPMLRSAAGFYTFGLFWGCAFINAMGYMIVAGTVYLCTFAGPGGGRYRAVPNSVMTTSFCTITRYHMGTAALGSLILTLLWPFRIVVNLFARLGSWDNQTMQYFCCCFQCCVSCFDGCMKYMNKMAYLQTVLHGFNFLNGAFSGMNCILKGLNQIGPTTFISSFVIVVIKLSVTLLITAMADGALTSGAFGVKKSEIEHLWVPFACVALSTYVIITGFMLILEVAIDAIMVAYCEAKFVPLTENDQPDGAITHDQLPEKLLQHMEAFGRLDGKGRHLAAPGEETALLQGVDTKGDGFSGQE